jgi:hypothetical protein
MNCNNPHLNALWRNWPGLLLLTLCVVFSATLAAGEREQAKRIYDRLIGAPPTNAMLDAMHALVVAGDAVQAAKIAIDDPDNIDNPNNTGFYNVTLKNFAAPWINEDQSVFVPLNDYSATVIGLIRDSATQDFHQLLYGDIIYTGGNAVATAYSASNNNHYRELETIDLKTTLQAAAQSSLNGLPAAASAGVITSRAAAEAFFIAGTNRAMFRFIFINHLCTDLEPLKDISRVPDHVRRDVSRSPGGDSRIFQNSCVACHAGMDGMMGAFAYYDFNTSSGRLDYQASADKIPNPDGEDFANPNAVVNKFNHNETNFKYGYIQRNDSWVNYWRNGQNSLLGWYNSVPVDSNGHASGNGARALGMELAHTDAFDSCQVNKVFQTICLRDPENFNADRDEVRRIAALFKVDGNMINVFAEVAAYCKGS